MTGPARSTIADDIIAIIQASTKTALAALEDSAVQYGTRTFTQMFAVRYRKGIYVGVSRGPLEHITMAGEKQDLSQILQLQVFVAGHDPKNDQRLCITMAEEVEEELHESANMRLANGGDFLGVPEFLPGPPVAKGNLTLHFVLMEVLYRKTCIL